MILLHRLFFWMEGDFPLDSGGERQKYKNSCQRSAISGQPEVTFRLG
jgi:hypothetical protein